MNLTQSCDRYAVMMEQGPKWLTQHRRYQPGEFEAICYDRKRRHCPSWVSFLLARETETFPIYWFWPDQVPVSGLSIPDQIILMDTLRDAFVSGWIDGGDDSINANTPSPGRADVPGPSDPDVYFVEWMQSDRDQRFLDQAVRPWPPDVKRMFLLEVGFSA